ncbi:MAG: hypothetical protein R3F62_07330 [Planctomycetota bacterium]
MKAGRVIKFPTTEATRRSTREVYAEPLTQGGARFSARSAYRQAA